MGCPNLTYRENPTPLKVVYNAVKINEKGCAGFYRYGFNGKEKDSEGMGGGGSTYDYGFRIYNPQIGKFLSVDPLFQSYPWYTPYQFAGNMPIAAIDLDGLEEYLTIMYSFKSSKGKTIIYKVDFQYVQEKTRVDKKNGFWAFAIATAKNGKLIYEKNQRISNSIFKNLFSKTDLIKNQNKVLRKGNLPGFIKESIDNARKVNGDASSVFVLRNRTILFESDKGASVEQVDNFHKQGESRMDNLDEIAQFLINVPDAKVIIEGNASLDWDENGNVIREEENQQLSEERAEATKEYLLNYIRETLGVEDFDESRITTVGLGTQLAELKGLSSDSSEEERTPYQNATIKASAP